MLRLNLMSIFVDDVQEALKFYTTKLGFTQKIFQESINYVTVGMPDNDVELLLEPNENIVAKNYQEGLYKQGIPAASFGTDNLDLEYDRLMSLGVNFVAEPTEAFGARLAIFDDEQGNFIQLVETKGQ